MKRSGRKSSWGASWRSFPTDPIGWVIELLLFALLTFAPFAFGAVEPWSELVVIVLATMLASCVAMRLLVFSSKPMVKTWAYAPLLLFLLLAALQLVPLPAKLISVLSPNTVATRQHFLSDLPDSAQQLKAFPLSLYPHATRHDLRLVIAASAVFFAVVNYYRRPEQIKRLLGGIAVIGSLVGLLAFAQDVSGTLNVYFIGPPGRGRASAGPFIHYSHFSQFMNLCVGATLGLLLVILYRKFRRNGFKVSDLPRRWQDMTLRPMWILAGVICLGVTTVFLSGSRGGMLATFIAFGLVTASLSAVKDLPGQGWLILPLVLMVFGVASFFGFDAFVNRLDTLLHADQTGGRFQMLEDLTHEWKQYPLLGTGLGTHEVVYPRYDRSTELARATHAEDEYAQVIEEMGFTGFTLVIWFAAVIWINFGHTLRKGDVSSQMAVTGLGFALIAVSVHSLTDFGEHTPAVGCLTAVICGLIISVARVPHLAENEKAVAVPAISEEEEEPQIVESKPEILRPTPPFVWSFGRFGLGGLTAIILAVGMWAVLGAEPAFAAAGEWDLAASQEKMLSQNTQNNLQTSPDDLADLVAHATTAVDRDPDDVVHRCFLNVYRWQQAASAVDGTAQITPAVRQACQTILSDLTDARYHCPVYGPNYYLAAQIEEKVFHDPVAEHHAQDAYELSQTDTGASFLAARFDVKAGRWTESKVKFLRYMALSGGYGAVADLYVREAGRPDLALDLAQNDAQRLALLATILQNDSRYSKLAAQIDVQAYLLMKQRCARADASPELLAEFAEETLKRKDVPTAIALYRRAIALDYGQVDWHLALANALAQTQQVPDAMHEAEICLRLRPEMPAAQKMIGELSLLPSGHEQ